MKINFIGTSHGFATPGRFCQSIIIETEKGDYVFDTGAPIGQILSARDYNFGKIRDVFITHVHADHICGINELISVTHWHYPYVRWGIYMPEKERGIDQTEAFSKMLQFGKSFEDRINFILFEEGDFFDDGNIKVTAVHTDHLKNTTNKAFGFLIEGEGKKVYITGDMHASLGDFPKDILSQPIDAVITECSHFPPERLAEKFKDTKAKKIYAVHVFPLSNYQKLDTLRESFPGELVFPSDNDIYDV